MRLAMVFLAVWTITAAWGSTRDARAGRAVQGGAVHTMDGGYGPPPPQ
jgi:hypothetical protein